MQQGAKLGACPSLLLKPRLPPPSCFTGRQDKVFIKSVFLFELFCLFYKAPSKSSKVSERSILIMIFSLTFIQCISWRHIQFWLGTFFKFFPYVCKIRRLWLLLRPLKFPILFTEMSLNWKALARCTRLLGAMCSFHLPRCLCSGFQVPCSLRAAAGSCGCACSCLRS